MTIAERYELVERLYDGRVVTVFRARDRQDASPVVVKQIKPEFASGLRIQHEYEILKNLRIPGVVPVRAIEEHKSNVALVRDDVGGETLAARLASGPLSLEDALRVARDIAEALGQVHHHRIIHKDVNPSNILLGEGGKAWLIDFDIATRLPREIQSVRTPNLLAGTLAYISPEQTGRMNRTVDYRTDLYSFGVTFYQMLTGRVPFPSRDPVELVYCHIAKTVTPPSEVNPEVPGVISDMVMRLLQKTAESRYQSAFGIRADIDECIRQLAENGRVEPFPLARHDVSDRFQVPQKLYGRQGEIAALERSFSRVREGKAELLLVAGSSGIGKSSVTHELYKSLSHSRGYFVSGKFDQLKQDIPFSALLQALSELVRTLLAESEEQLSNFRERILKAVSGAGRVLTDVLPDLERVIGAQPPVAELPAAESRNRFRIIFENFIHVFTQHGEPLVILLDDLQWADAATLDVLTALLGAPDVGSLLIIGAYRDNEVPPGHPLLSTIEKIEKQSCVVTRMLLGPIGTEHVRELLEETLSITAAEAQPLAELLWQRTGGNPLFVGELLTMLHKNGFLEFDPVRRRWTFDLDRIARAPGTDSVVQLMAVRAAALDPATQEILRLAAVLGNLFDLGTLAVVAERSLGDTRAALEGALQEGLVLALGQRIGDGSSTSILGPADGNAVYRFLHDRVQQTIYMTIPEDAKVGVHAKVGKLLLKSRPKEEHDEWLFNVLHHLNLAASHVRDAGERVELAELNLAAARRARASGAFAAAATHYQLSIQFLPESAWTTHHDLMYALHHGQAECGYLSGQFDLAERLFDVILTHAASDMERVQLYWLMATYYKLRTRFQESLRMALKAVELLGITIDPKPDADEVFRRVREAIGDRTPEDLLALPEMKDARRIFAFRVLRDAVTGAYYADKHFFAELVSKIIFSSLEHGNSSGSAIGFLYYGLVLGTWHGDYAAGDAYGRLAMRIVERYPDKAVEAQVRVWYGCTIQGWRHYFKETLPNLEEGWKCGIQSGELMAAGTGLGSTLRQQVAAGYPLEALGQLCETTMNFIRKVNRRMSELEVMVHTHTALALRGLTASPGSFDAPGFDEAERAAELRALQAKHIWHIYLAGKRMVLYVLGRYEEALQYSIEARNGAHETLGPLYVVVEHHYFDALIVAALAEQRGCPPEDMELLDTRARTLKHWADNAPWNYRHKYLIVAAEIARLRRDDRAALAQYDEAIKLARDNDFLGDEAIARELVGKFFMACGLSEVGLMYLWRARLAYERWNASAKIALLDQTYPELLTRSAQQEQFSLEHTTTARTAGGDFDAPSMIKASHALSGEIALEKLLSRMMNIVAENAGAERGVLIIKRGDQVTVSAEFATSSVVVLERPTTVEESAKIPVTIVNYVLRSQANVVLNNATKEGTFTSDPYVATRNTKSVLCAPLLHKGVVHGALYLENNLVSGAFTKERAEFLSVLCAQMAISIENAYLYANLEDKVAERTRALEQAQARVVQLEKDATEMRMAGGFAHEMRNALTGAGLMLSKVYVDKQDDEHWSACLENGDKLMTLFTYLKERMRPEELQPAAKVIAQMRRDEEQIDRVLGGLKKSIARGLGITGLILDYAQIGRERRGDDVVPVTALMDNVFHDLREDLAAKGIELEIDVPEGCLIVGNERHFHSIFKNLVLNARDALMEASDDRARRISVRAYEDRARVVISVEDTGPGIPADLQEKIFEPFYSTKPHTGTGLGLGMVRKLCSLYGATVELVSEPPQGTTFRIGVPKNAPLVASA